jgi:large subunit ribosomal protein L1
MQKHSKRFNELEQLVDKTKLYSVEEAIQILIDNSKVKFDETVEIHMNLGIDPRKSDQLVRGTMVLPHGTGKTKKVLVIAEGEAAQAAKEAGADMVGDEEVIAEIKKTGNCDFDVVLATPDMMRKLAPIARILGTKGLMPNPKKDTVTPNVAGAVKDVKGGKIAYRNDDTSNMHQAIGKLSFGAEKLIENATLYIETIRKAKPEAQKGQYIKSLSITSTMGPGIKVTSDVE